MENIIIRDYISKDYPAIESLWSITKLGGTQRGDNQHIIEKSIAMGGKMLIAEDASGKLIATSWMTYDGRRLHLHHFGVLPSYQRQGTGRALAKASVSFAHHSGVQIKLEVHKDNKAAIALYKQLGFGYLGDYVVYIIRNP